VSFTPPENVPAELIAGDLWSWVRTLSDYPAPTWTLTYYFENSGRSFSVIATTSGTGFAASATAATTTSYAPGRYRWRARVTNGAEAYTVESGWLVVRANPAAAGTYDARSHVRKVLDAIEATIEGRASNDQLSMSIAGRSISRTPMTELVTLREKYLAFVADEENAEDVAAGLGSKKRVFVRMSRG
jgi:hypothetical protein